MKKTLIAVSLPFLLFACSESNDKGSSTSKLDSATIEAFTTDYTNARQALANAGSYRPAKNPINFALTADSIMEQDKKLNFLAVLSLVEESKESPITMSFNWTEKSIADIKGYTSNKGKVTIDSSADMHLTVANNAGGSVFDGLLLDKGVVKTIFDAAKYTLTNNMTFVEQKHEVNVEGQNIGYYTLDKLASNDVVEFNKNFKEISSVANEFNAAGFTLTTSPEIAPLFSGAVTINDMASKSHFQKTPFLLKGDMALNKLAFTGTSGNYQYKIAVPKITFAVDAKEKDTQATGNISYNLENIQVDFGAKGKGDFGAVGLELGATGIKISDTWQELFQDLAAIQSPEQLSPDEAQALLQQFFGLFTKDASLSLQLTNTLTSGGAFKSSFTIKPSEKFIALGHENIEALFERLGSGAPAEAVTDFLDSLSFELTVPESYAMEQYASMASFNGKTREDAQNEAKMGLQMGIMAAALQGAQMGITPVVFENGVISINVSYAKQQWTINGKTMTSEALFKLL